jgi:hypothetical protein
MKKKFLIGIAAIAVAAVAAVNVSTTSSRDLAILSLTLTEVEALSIEWNEPVLWPTQGLTKDERSYEDVCYNSTTSETTTHREENSSTVILFGNGSNTIINTSYSYTNTTQSTTVSQGVKITCGFGDENCTPKDC